MNLVKPYAGYDNCKVEVRNTFINCLVDDADDYEELFRSVSDPMGRAYPPATCQRQVQRQCRMLEAADEKEEDEEVELERTISMSERTNATPKRTSSDDPLKWLAPTPLGSPRGLADEPLQLGELEESRWRPQAAHEDNQPICGTSGRDPWLLGAAEDLSPAMPIGHCSQPAASPAVLAPSVPLALGMTAVAPIPVPAGILVPALAPPFTTPVPALSASSPSAFGMAGVVAPVSGVAGIVAPAQSSPAVPLVAMPAPVPPAALGFATVVAAVSMPAGVVAPAQMPMVPRQVPLRPCLSNAAVDPPMPVSASCAKLLPLGRLHHFHLETAESGELSSDQRHFRKENFAGRLSVITEDQVHSDGVHRYALRFVDGELSSADGVGFIFSTKLPCPKNIQRIVSIFANRTGRICVRANAEVVRSPASVKALEIGDWVSVTVDLDSKTAGFTVWPADGSAPSSASICFGAALHKLKRTNVQALPSSGYFACVVKNFGVSVELGS